MKIEFFNFWYFFWIIISGCLFFLIYLLLKNKNEKVKKHVLFSLLIVSLLLHFLKLFIPPYSTDILRLYRDSWFTNICAANILVFPFIYLSKNNTAKDFMFYIGVISGVLSILLPLEPINKVDQTKEVLDIVRFYMHHNILWIVPLLMVIFKIHSIDYRRIWKIPGCLMLLLLFIIINQILQSELGFVPLRGDDLLKINYKNTSLIWGPNDDLIGKVLSHLCPNIFKIVPVGNLVGEAKYWPWFWLLVPAYVILVPLSFGISLIFDRNHIKQDFYNLKYNIGNKIKTLGGK